MKRKIFAMVLLLAPLTAAAGVCTNVGLAPPTERMDGTPFTEAEIGGYSYSFNPKDTKGIAKPYTGPVTIICVPRQPELATVYLRIYDKAGRISDPTTTRIPAAKPTAPPPDPPPPIEPPSPATTSRPKMPGVVCSGGSACKPGAFSF